MASKSDQPDHRDQDTQEMIDNLYECEYCHKFFEKEQYLKKHQEIQCRGRQEAKKDGKK